MKSEAKQQVDSQKNDEVKRLVNKHKINDE